MTFRDNSPRSPARKRGARIIAVTAAVGIASTAIVAAGGGNAAAAAPPLAQSVGRFADGSIGNMAIQKLADIKDARATAPGKQSVQNPFDVTLFNAINLPLTNVFTIPTNPAVNAGVINQVAQARLDGSSFGAAGAVANDGAITAGKKTNTFPTVAEINLSQAALGGAGAGSLPLPGAGSAPSLGSITGKIGAVAANARTQVGGKVSPTPMYNIAGLQLALASPALGGVLAQLATALNPANLPPFPGLPGFPQACTLTQTLLAPISFAGGGIAINPLDGTITVDLAKLLVSLGLNINKLPANTDLVAYLLKYIADPSGLAKGLQGTLTSITQPGQDKLTACLTAIGQATPALQVILAPLVTAINNGSAQLQAAVTQLSNALANAAPGAPNPFQPLSDGLKKVIDIGVNVESGPGIQKQQTDPALKFTTQLRKTPNQNTPVVKNQTLIRALEVNVLDTSSVAGNFRTPAVAAAPSLPGLPGAPGLPTPGAGQTLLTLALANAAVGPSRVTTAAPTTSASPPAPPTSVPPTDIPTGVPAGAAGEHGGSPVLPLVVLLLGLTLAGGGFLSHRLRGKYTP